MSAKRSDDRLITIVGDPENGPRFHNVQILGTNTITFSDDPETRSRISNVTIRGTNTATFSGSR